MGRSKEQNLQQQERLHAEPITATTTTTTTTTTVMGLHEDEVHAVRVEQAAMASTTTTQSLQVAQQLQQNRLRHAPVITREPVRNVGPVADPYAGMSRVKRYFAKNKEKNRIEKNRSRAKKAQEQAAKLFGRKPENFAPDMLELLQRGQNFEKLQQMPFDLQQASAMQLDLTCFAEQDYVNDGTTIDIERMLQQGRTLDQIAQVREAQRPVWESLDAQTRARCQTLLDQRDAYRACMYNTLMLHNLKLDENGKLCRQIMGGGEKQRQDAAQALEMLRVRQLMAEASAADYEAAPQQAYTEQEKLDCMEAERAAYHKQFGNLSPLAKMDEVACRTLIQNSQKLPEELRNRVKDWSAQYQALQQQPERIRQWDKNQLKIGALDRDAMIAIGAQGLKDFDQATEEEKRQHFAEADRLMVSVTQLCRLEKDENAVPGLSVDQAVENAYEMFSLCFDRFKAAFEQARSGLQTAFTPEGKLLQMQQIGRFYGWWQALKEIYAQSPRLTARIPLDQMAYVRAVALHVKQGNTDIQDMIAQQKAGKVLRNRSINDPEEYARLSSEVHMELEKTVKAEHLTKNHPLRVPVERYAAKTGVSLDTALHILREMGYQEDFAEQFRTTDRQVGAQAASLREQYTLCNPEQKEKDILKQSDARMQSVKALLRSRYSEQEVTAMGAAAVAIKGQVISGLKMDRFIVSLPVMQPGITDEEIAQLIEKNYQVCRYVQASDMQRDLEKESASMVVNQVSLSQTKLHAGLRSLLTNEQMKQLDRFDQQMLTRLKAHLDSAEQLELQHAEEFVQGLTDEQRAALQGYETELNKVMQQSIEQRREDPISLLSPAKQKTYQARQAYLNGLTEEEHRQVEESAQYMREKLQTLLLHSLDTMQQKFGNHLSKLHIMDILTLMGEDYFQYISITQDLIQIVEGMHGAGMLDEDTYQSLFEQADYWISMSRIKYLQKDLEGDTDLGELQAAQHRLAGQMRDNPRQDGPRMTEEQYAAYIQHVRLRYPDMLYGDFA